jgi:hypothetical protein
VHRHDAVRQQPVVSSERLCAVDRLAPFSGDPVRRDDHDGAVGMLQDRLGDASQEEALEPGEASRSHDDRIGVDP